MAVGPTGAPLEILDVVDRLTPSYSRLFVVDLDAVEQDRPQLDYLQEIARDTDVWLDAGVRTADEAIDALITGASRAVMSTSLLRSAKVLARAWKLSQDLVFEVEIRTGAVDTSIPEWSALSPVDLAAVARAVGIPDVILTYREGPIDWSVVREVGRDRPNVGRRVVPALAALRPEPSRGRRGIFHLSIRSRLARPSRIPLHPTSQRPPGGAR